MKNFFKNFRSYSFWVSLSGAIIILLNAFGRAFGFEIENQIVEDCLMSVAGVLIVLGVVIKPRGQTNSSDEINDKNKNDEQEKTNEEDANHFKNVDKDDENDKSDDKKR